MERAGSSRKLAAEADRRDPAAGRARRRPTDGACRRRRRRSREPEPRKTVEELLAELDALVGLTEVKAEIHRQAAVLRVEGLRAEAGLEGADDHPAPDLQRQPRHRQDDRRPAGRRHLPRARPALEGPARRGRPLRAGGRLPRPDRDEDRRGREVRRGRRAVHRRGLLARRRPVRHRGDRHPGQGDGGQARRPGRHRRRLPAADGGLHRPEPRPREPLPHHHRLRRLHRRRARRDLRGDGRPARSTTSTSDVARPAARDPGAPSTRGPTFGNARYVRNVLEAAIGRHAWRLRDVEAPTLEQLRTLLAEDLDRRRRSTEPGRRSHPSTDDRPQPRRRHDPAPSRRRRRRAPAPGTAPARHPAGRADAEDVPGCSTGWQVLAVAGLRALRRR